MGRTDAPGHACPLGGWEKARSKSQTEGDNVNEILDALLRALAFGTPLLLASLGAIVNERAGVVNLGVEGMMALGALAGFAVAYGGGMGGNLWLAVLAAMLVGALAALLHAFVTITMRANQFVSGLALTLLGLGLAGLLGKQF